MTGAAADSAPKISLIVITRNEEELIGQCLRSAATFCDELIVVDSFSTDRTAEIARGLGARVFQRPFEGYIAQKQFALEQASGNGSSRSTPTSRRPGNWAAKFARRSMRPHPAAGYRVRRVLYHLGHYYTRGLYPDWHLRLFRRERARFGGHEPHASVQISRINAGD